MPSARHTHRLASEKPNMRPLHNAFVSPIPVNIAAPKRTTAFSKRFIASADSSLDAIHAARFRNRSNGGDNDSSQPKTEPKPQSKPQNIRKAAVQRKEPLSKEPRSSSKSTPQSKSVALPGIPANAVPYFAYFANMNPNKLGPMSTISFRRCNVFRSQPAVLTGYKLIFNVPGIPPEPAFANLQSDSPGSIHGVLHWLSPDDFERVAFSEGVIPSRGPFSLLSPLKTLGSKVIPITVTINHNGHSSVISAKTLVFPSIVPAPFTRFLRPSRRYLQVAIDGAEYWKVDSAYIAELREIPFERGPLGGFGLLVEPRPHILDRPNPDAQFGDSAYEIYSPFRQYRSRTPVEKYQKAELDADGVKLRLVHLSDIPQAVRPTKRRMYFIPGIDGTGKSILSQMDEMDDEGIYDVSTIVYPFENRQTMQQLAAEIIQLIADDAQGQPVSIMGESMGGTLAIMSALENARRHQNESTPQLSIDLLLLLNPATNYSAASQRQLFDFLLSLGFSEDMYSTLLPLVLLPFVIDVDAIRQNFGPGTLARLRKLLFALNQISAVLPQDAMSWRLKLLSNFSISGQELKPLSGQYGPRKTALISSINDNLVPSHSESYRLRSYIPDLYTAVLGYGGHVPMFDSRHSLADLLKPFSRPPAKPLVIAEPPPNPKMQKRRERIREKFPDSTAHLVEAKSRQDLRRLRDYVKWSTKNCSPVFIGEENIPEYNPDKPVLFVCNHTLMGWLDAMNPVLRMLETRKILVRSYGHPRLFSQGTVRLPNTTPATLEDIAEFGVVKVSPQSLLEQLANGRWSILFPGGAKEALKQPGERKYSLKWPESPELIRSCALFGATIIPISTVGTEDMVRVVASSKQVEKVLTAGERVLGRSLIPPDVADNAKEWKGAANGEESGSMIPPLMLPVGVDRIYYRFGKPIEISEDCLTDEKLERKVYAEARESVAEGIEILLKRRKADQYRSTRNRRKFVRDFGEDMVPPAGEAWVWMKNGAYLDEDAQPPLR